MTSTCEMWKPVKGFEQYYEISNFGRVRSLDRMVPGRHGEKIRRGKIIAQCGKQDNPLYKRVHLSIDGKAKWLQVHRLVAEAFVDNPHGYSIVNHLDNDPSNNHASNLEWTTQSGNIQHAVKQGRWHSKEVIRIDADGNQKSYKSILDAAKDVGIKSPVGITFACRDPKRSAGGYKWKYKEGCA